MDYDLEKKITVKESYNALYIFLRGYYDLTENQYIGDLLSYLSTDENGNVMDQALEQDWFKAIEKSLNGDVDTRLALTKED